jgi:hypothetical protein
LSWTPISPDVLPSAVASWIADTPGTVRVAVDGPPCTHPGAFANALSEPLRVLARPIVHIPSSSFWRDASLRLEFGRHDTEAFAGWLDSDALRREVLVPIREHGAYLPSLRDPVSNRSTREPVRASEPGTVLVVSGQFLLGLGLPFDRIVHLAMSPAARARHTPDEDAWTLPAFERYDDEVAPAEVADVVIRLEDPRHPAVRGLP